MTPWTRPVHRSAAARLAVMLPGAALAGLVLAGCAASSPSPATSPSTAASPSSGSVTDSAAPTGTAATPAATASPAHPSSSVNPGGPMTAAECTSAQLKVAYTGNAQIRHGALDGMSKADSVITFTNVGAKACRTRGYPGLAALDSSGHQIKQAVRGKAMNGQEPLITLAPGQAASALITGNTASCTKLTKIAAFLVTAPNQRTPVRLAGSHLMCLNSLGIAPLQPGDAGGVPLQ
jgi:hypothetical protein